MPNHLYGFIPSANRHEEAQDIKKKSVFKRVLKLEKKSYSLLLKKMKLQSYLQETYNTLKSFTHKVSTYTTL